MAAVPVFFELSWSILCTTCIGNVLLGCLVCGITNWTLLAAVPMSSSAAGAIANGLCYYVYYEKHPPMYTAIASVFADIFWLKPVFYFIVTSSSNESCEDCGGEYSPRSSGQA
ncbi:hypothetical protein BFJ69_g17603 [Fusarium oxysporum]|uniref:Uncharacterized protein n=1 Tax=Fusarium oxysporum TaxID=5507 RepID=A0A420M7U5_FUSOX|nr:hypothetical protein BFJ69_g17603 [Fusarium oxysporum]